MEFKGTKGKWERIGTFVMLHESDSDITFGGFGIEKEYNAQLVCKSKDMLEAINEFIFQFENNDVQIVKTYLKLKEIVKQATEI